MKHLMATVAVLTIGFGVSTDSPLFAAEVCQGNEIIIKFSHVVSANTHPKGIAADLLAERVNDEMDGMVCMKVYPNSTLYNDDKVLEAMLFGNVQLAAPSLSKFERFTKKLRIFDFPFLFDSVDVVKRFQQSEYGQRLKDSMRGRGLQGLAFWHNGMKQLSANKPLIEPSDAAGLKFRVQQSDVLVTQFEALDANPQKMAFSEVYGALQTGTIDGQENTWSNIYNQKVFEVQDGVTESDHGILDYLVVTSVEWWEGLPEDVRSQLGEILAEVTKKRNDEAIAVNRRARELIIVAGGTVRELSDAQRAKWKAAMKPVWKQFEDDVGSEWIKAAQSYNK